MPYEVLYGNTQRPFIIWSIPLSPEKPFWVFRLNIRQSYPHGPFRAFRICPGMREIDMSVDFIPRGA